MNREQSSTMNGDRRVGSYKYVLSESEQRLRVTELSVQLLIARTKSGDFSSDGFQDTAKLLETVPLTTSEFESARRHLRNAFEYSRQSEFGAATFELRIVRGILQRL